MPTMFHALLITQPPPILIGEVLAPILKSTKPLVPATALKKPKSIQKLDLGQLFYS